MPFLVDSIGMVLTQAGLTIHMMVHPVLPIQRDRAGACKRWPRTAAMPRSSRRNPGSTSRSTGSARPNACRSWNKSCCARSTTCNSPSGTGRKCASGRPKLAHEIERDNPAIQPNEAREAKTLLDWMAANHFTFLGYRQYRLKRGRSEDLLEAIPETGLGILRIRRGYKAEPTPLTGELRDHARQPELLTITKANSVSTVHRATYLDYVGVKTFDSARTRHRREAFSRPVHVGGLQPQPARNSPAPAQDRARRRALRPRSGQPRRQGRGPRARNLSARRAVPGHAWRT